MRHIRSRLLTVCIALSLLACQAADSTRVALDSISKKDSESYFVGADARAAALPRSSD
jgi:hypothetical protein